MPQCHCKMARCESILVKDQLTLAQVSNIWAFSVKEFAGIYASMFKVLAGKLMNKLWRENFFNKKTKKWATAKSPDNEHALNTYILDPNFKLFDAFMNFKKEEMHKLLETLKLKLTREDKDKEGKPLLKVVMETWLPAGDPSSTVIFTISLHHDLGELLMPQCHCKMARCKSILVKDQLTLAQVSNIWAFSLKELAGIYASMFKVLAGKLMNKLYGENFFNKKTKKWATAKS
ncbi:uncharacterized protein [Panulirus ornatus]|uniref:uncharacterized protein isoform X1 n=1 Tax=Panulirus ornatus TaxID=150431 RepID=UPI003A85117A